MAFTYDDNLYSDLYKDAWGVRPGEWGYKYWNSLSPAEKQVQWDYLIGEMNKRCDEEAAMEKLAISRFEAQIQHWIEIGAKTREDAIRWFHQAEDTNGDNDYLCYRLGLPYGYVNA
jgi:hypothetical protein